ncbi:MAG: hypothetical protein ABIR58_08470 [Gemmatimonadaceae bacterium]
MKKEKGTPRGIEPDMTDDDNPKAMTDESVSGSAQAGQSGHGGSGKDADLQGGKQSESDRAAGKSG